MQLDIDDFIAWLGERGQSDFRNGRDAWDSDAVACWIRDRSRGRLERPRVGVASVAAYDLHADDWRECYFARDFWVSRFVTETIALADAGHPTMTRREAREIALRLRDDARAA